MESYRQLQTARLELTALSLDDLAEFHALHSDPALYQHAPLARHPDLAHSESVLNGLIEDWATRELCYWTVRSASGSYLGCAGVRRTAENWNVYYRFSVGAWGNGYACEVIRTAAECAEQLEPGATLQAMVRPWNHASRRVAERLGMQRCLEQADHNGVPELIYQIAAAEVRASAFGDHG